MVSSRPDTQFARLAAFIAMPLKDAAKKYKLARFTGDIDFEDMFGVPPENVFVAKGTVKAKAVRLKTAQYAGIYIIDGDLVVDGALDFTHLDGAAVLCVLGSVRAKTLTITDEAQLWIAKDLVLSGLLTNRLSDAGALQVVGKTTTGSDGPRSGKRAPSTKEHPAIAKLATLEPMTLDDADKRFGLRVILDVAECETPQAVYVHTGNASARGVVDLREPAPDGRHAAYIIDGDLDVDGVLAIDSRSMSTWGILVVTGNVRVKQLGCICDGKLWVGGNLDVSDIAIANKLHVVGEANIPMLVMRMMLPRFAKLPSITSLVDIDVDPLESWQSAWHASLPARVLQSTALPTHAGSSIEKLVEALIAGESLRA